MWSIDDMVALTCNKANEYGIKGVEEDEVFIEEIKFMEVLDKEVRSLMDAKLKAYPWMSCHIILEGEAIQLKGKTYKILSSLVR